MVREWPAAGDCNAGPCCCTVSCSWSHLYRCALYAVHCTVHIVHNQAIHAANVQWMKILSTETSEDSEHSLLFTKSFVKIKS